MGPESGSSVPEHPELWVHSEKREGENWLGWWKGECLRVNREDQECKSARVKEKWKKQLEIKNYLIFLFEMARKPCRKIH